MGTSSRSRGHSGLAVAVVVLVVTLFTSIGSAAAIDVGPTAVSAVIRPVLIQEAASRGVLLDPVVVEDVIASVVTFSTTLCVGGAQAEELCRRTLFNPPVLRRIIGEYLTEVLDRRPTSLEAVGSRLAHVVGVDIADAGWPNNTSNNFGVLTVAPALRQHTFELQTSSGPQALGSGAMRLLMRPGQVSLIARRDDGQVVRLTVNVSSRAVLAIGPITTPTVAAIGQVEPNTAQFCYNKEPVTYVGATAVFNWGRGRLAVDRNSDAGALLAAHAKQAVLDIIVTNESGGACDKNCMRGLGASFARSVAVWRSGCARCDANALSVIRIDDTVWLDRGIVDRLRKRIAGPKVSLNLSDRPSTFHFVTPPPWADGTTVGRFVAYDEVSNERALTQTICALATSEAGWVQGAQQFVCGRPAASSTPLKPHVTLTANDTRCGTAENFIACGTPGGGVEITLKGSRFSLLTPAGVVIIGNGAPPNLDLEAVVLHEVGHWFGVPHSEATGASGIRDIMSSTYGDGPPCVSAQALIMVNNAADTRWPYRVAGPQGLKRRKPVMGGR